LEDKPAASSRYDRRKPADDAAARPAGGEPGRMRARALRRCQDRGLLTLDDDRVYLTESGRLLADGIIADVLIAEEE